MPRPSYRTMVHRRGPCGDPLGNDNRLTFGEDACLWRADAGHVADGIHVGEGGLEREGIDGNPAVDRHSCPLDDLRDAVLRDPEEQVVGHLAPSARRADAAGRIERPHQCLGMPRDLALHERGQERFRRGGGGRDRHGQRHDQRDLGPLPNSEAHEVVVHQEAVSLGAGGHLNGVEVTATITRPPAKPRARHVTRMPLPPCRTRTRPR